MKFMSILRKRFTLAFLILGMSAGATVSMYGQSQDKALAEHRARLDAAVARLNAQRQQIQEQQLPLARKLIEEKERVDNLRQELIELQTIQDRDQVALQALEKRIAEGQREYDYITRTLLSEYTASYQTLLTAGEKETFGEVVRQLNLFAESESATEPEVLNKSLELLKSSLQRVQQLVGGKLYAGQALDPSGKMLAGKFIQLGPLLYFASEDGKTSGIIQESLGLRPQVRSIGKNNDQLIAEFAQSGEGALPVDPTLQNALLIAETKDSFMEHLYKGGIWVIPIASFAIIATIAALIKMLQIFSIRHPDGLVAHELAVLVRNGQLKEAAALARKQPKPARELLVHAVEHAEEPIELVEEVMYESMLTIQPRLERFLNWIAITAAVGPLLGLLGTVTGIIKTFKLMHVFGAGDPRPLISGISEALITTELGLAMAIPALVIHALLSRKVVGIMARLEKLSVAFINGLSRKTLVV